MSAEQHFQGQFELELKYRVEDKQAFLAVLGGLEHEVMFEDNQESDWFYDTPERKLSDEGKSLVIREIEPSGIKLWIVKGPEKDRCEATDITKSHAAKSMLENMGYEVILQTKKVRSIYFIGSFHITLDHLEGIGHFAEFAIMTDDESALARYKQELEALAARFGLDESHKERRSYKQMWQTE
ncbi:class IV adenylate cyclase [Vibrio rotiferianus]|uniref:class IV adenylate cyclase n=1 Tax=Vibrio rotiferianus TaxID=190895 RepID=UPI002894FDEC|nr:Adenylate cyclase CyaB [Vibrio rotiferianus]